MCGGRQNLPLSITRERSQVVERRHAAVGILILTFFFSHSSKQREQKGNRRLINVGSSSLKNDGLFDFHLGVVAQTSRRWPAKRRKKERQRERERPRKEESNHITNVKLFLLRLTVFCIKRRQERRGEEREKQKQTLERHARLLISTNIAKRK